MQILKVSDWCSKIREEFLNFISETSVLTNCNKAPRKRTNVALTTTLLSTERLKKRLEL